LRRLDVVGLQGVETVDVEGVLADDRSDDVDRIDAVDRRGRRSRHRLAGAVGGGEADVVEHRSITVCRRRAPMFSTLALTSTATSAIASMASSVKSSVTPSVAISATYCLIRLASGSVRMRRKSSGQRAQLDADRQAALQLGQQVRRLGDVERARGDEQDVVGLHRPVLGRDVVPSISGSRSRCTPSRRDVGAAAALARAQILSISSRKTMPLFSTARSPPGRPGPVEQLVALLGDQDVVDLLDGRAASWCGRRRPCRACRRG
jgi:hypothetical protein